MTVKGKTIELEQGKDFYLSSVQKVQRQNRWIIGINAALLACNMVLAFEVLDLLLWG